MKRIMMLLLLFTIANSWASTNEDPTLAWNKKALDLVVASGRNTPQANRLMALVHSAQYESFKAMHKKMGADKPLSHAIYGVLLSSSLDYVLSLEAPQSPATFPGYKRTLKLDEKDISAAVKVAVAASTQLMLSRRFDGAERQESYRPHTQAGVYVPTSIPATPQWVKRKAWYLTSPKQFRAAKPPALNSKTWLSDFNEVKEIGRQYSKSRSKEQTLQAKFWQATLPPIYHGVLRSAVQDSDMSSFELARFFAVASQAIDDAMVAVMDSKYHHAFWRPITAIRNADIDDNEGTKRDPNWLPYIPTPMHPEYPCAHCVVASTVANIVRLELGDRFKGILSTCSYTLDGQCRSWRSPEDFVAEVTDARIYDGVHYRFSGIEGNKMGADIAKHVSAGAKHY